MLCQLKLRWRRGQQRQLSGNGPKHRHLKPQKIAQPTPERQESGVLSGQNCRAAPGRKRLLSVTRPILTPAVAIKKSGAFDSAGASCHGSAGQGQVTALPKKSLRPHPCERVEGQTEEKSESKRKRLAGTGFPADCIARAANVPKSIR